MPRLSLLLATVILTSLAAAPPASLAADREISFGRKLPGRTVTLRQGYDATAGRQPSGERADITPTTSPTADIRVSYSGFSPQAQAVFEAAVQTWERTIVSDTPIHVSASWEPLGSGVLGAAGPESFWLGSDGYAYPAALAEALCTCEKESGFELGAFFNSSFSGWYLGTDGNVPSNKYDLYSVVLHEIGHGLGFMSSFGVEGSIGYWGLWDGSEYIPMRFDAHERSAASGGFSLIDDSVVPNDSAALKAELTDGSVFFAGPNAVAAAGKRVRLYAPSPWDPGSSNSHVDQTTFEGTVDSLMTPALNPGQYDAAPGPITVAMMEDIGWSISDATTPPPPTAPANDLFANARQIGTFPFDDLGANNSLATLESSEPVPSCGDITATVWYRLQPTMTYSARFRATPVSSIDLVVAVYEVTSAGSLVQVGCADDASAAGEESVVVQVSPGRTYYVQVGGYPYTSPTGAFEFRARKVASSTAPVNDDFAQASSIVLGSASSIGTAGASLQAGEPSPPCEPLFGASVWYRYSPNKTRTVIATTSGSAFDTVVAVYAGNDLGSLAPIACNDDRVGTTLAKVKVKLFAGTTYHFQVSGFNGAAGALKFLVKKR